MDTRMNESARVTGSSLSLAAFLLSITSCATPIAKLSPASPAIFVVEVGGFEKFRMEVADPQSIEAAMALVRSGNRASILGDLAPGDAGINQPFRWHLVPASIRLEKDRLGKLDVLPSEVEDNLGHWLDEIKRYCPSASRIIARDR